jgi:nucleotide-binding universal stress UspA family protein
VYDRIIVALDGSPLAERCLPHAEALAEKFGSTIVLVRAILPTATIAALVEPSMGGVPLDPDVIEDTLEAGTSQPDRPDHPRPYRSGPPGLRQRNRRSPVLLVRVTDKK